MLDNGINELGKDFDNTIEAFRLSLAASDDDASKQMLLSIQALKQNIQIMQRLQSDVENGKSAGVSSGEISEIGDYALNLLDQLSIGCASRGLQEEMVDLHRMSMPVVAWLSQHGGRLSKLDIVVNAIASYANTIQDTEVLERLSAFIKQVVDVTETFIRQDLEAADPMRPWRILNLNWGIVATRTHNLEVMKYVFDRLIENIPADVRQFFQEGVQQMNIVDYPEPVKQLMRDYAEQVVGDGTYH